MTPDAARDGRPHVWAPARACGFDFCLREPTGASALLACLDDLCTRTRPPS